MNREDSRRRWSGFGLGGLIIAGLAYTGGTMMASPHPPSFTSPVAGGEMLRIQVSGSVKKPGVYSFNSGQRVEDAINSAGGPTSDARMSELNLAARLVDAMPLVVPGQDDQDPAVGPYSMSGAQPSSGGSTTPNPLVGQPPASGGGTISINNASASELEEIPGVGPAIAKRIIEYRSAHGGFKTIEELDEVNGIGPKTMEKFRPFIRL